MRTRLTPIDVATALALTREASVAMPVEQSDAWDRFDSALPGREPWQRLLYTEDGRDVAVVNLTRYTGRGFVYLWAKHGPVWLRPEGTAEDAARPSPAQEVRLRQSLVRAVRKADPAIAFVRAHFWHEAEDTHELLQTMPVDRTVVVPLVDETGKPLSDDELMASFKRRGRRDLRKGIRESPVEPVELTAEGAITRAQMDELYTVLEETADRDAFGINDKDVYAMMLQALGPKVARVFVGRDGNTAEGAMIAWNIVTVYDRHAVAYYGATTAEGRRERAAEQLYWFILRTMRDEGVVDFDFLGIDSERAPRLKGVAEFKRKFSEDIVDVAGAWDVPVRPLLYRGLVAALAAKRRATTGLRGAVAGARERLAGGGTAERDTSA